MQLKQIFDGSKSDHEAKVAFEEAMMSWFLEVGELEKQPNEIIYLGGIVADED